MTPPPAKQAFSLVELSIVLVILGLLVGGVLTGQSLIRAAELRSVTTEYQKYAAAVHTFRDKYFALPGDMPNATSFWGAAHAMPATCLTTVGTGTQTCNGDGNGWVADAPAPSQRGEIFGFWVHLANAGMVEGTYSGFAEAAGTFEAAAGVNVPSAKLSNAGWTMRNTGQAVFPGNEVAYAGDYGHYFLFGTNFPGLETAGAILRPEEAWNIDTKMDDGQPARGKVIARYWDDACAAADDGSSAFDDLNASYRLADSSVQCALFFVRVF